MKLYHHTKSAHVPSILADQILKLEGSNTERDAANHPQAAAMWQMLKMQYDLVGRYVWFTEEQHAKSTTVIHNDETTAIAFDKADLQVVRWYDIGRKIMDQGGVAKKVLRALNDAAKAAGDDPSKWWVSVEAIDLQSVSWEMS